MKTKFIFYLFWLIFLSLSPVSILSNTPLAKMIASPATAMRTILRISGLLLYLLLFWQLILGAFMSKWIEKFGAWIFKFHVFEGILIWLLIFLHPLAFTFFSYFIGRGFDPFYAFIDVCVICKKDVEFSYNFGRIGFWLLTAGVLAGLFRAATPFWRAHWYKFHLLNYAAFFVIYYHSLKLGSDVGTFPFSLVHTPTFLIILGIVIVKLLKAKDSLLKYLKPRG